MRCEPFHIYSMIQSHTWEVWYGMEIERYGMENYTQTHKLGLD